MKIRSVLMFFVLTLLLAFSVFELYNLSALYKDQVGMWEFEIAYSDKPVSAKEIQELDDLKFELNSGRAVMIGYMAFYLFFYLRKSYKLNKSEPKI